MALLLYGSKGFSRVVAELAVACGREVVGCIDDYAAAGTIGDFQQATSSYPSSRYEMAIAVGYNNLEGRWACYQRALAAGYSLPPLIHPDAIMARTVTVQAGAIVMAGACVDSFAALGEACVLWPGVILSHDSEVGCNSFLSPGAIICGHSRVGDNCFIGAGVIVVDHELVPDRSFVKAGLRFKNVGCTTDAAGGA